MPLTLLEKANQRTILRMSDEPFPLEPIDHRTRMLFPELSVLEIESTVYALEKRAKIDPNLGRLNRP